MSEVVIAVEILFWSCHNLINLMYVISLFESTLSPNSCVRTAFYDIRAHLAWNYVDFVQNWLSVGIYSTKTPFTLRNCISRAWNKAALHLPSHQAITIVIMRGVGYPRYISSDMRLWKYRSWVYICTGRRELSPRRSCSQASRLTLVCVHTIKKDIKLHVLLKNLQTKIVTHLHFLLLSLWQDP